MSSPDPERVREALEHWEAFLAGIHSCDLDEPTAVAVLHVNEAARAWLAGSSPDYEAAIEPVAAVLAGWIEPGYVGEDFRDEARIIIGVVATAAFPNREGGT